MSKRTNFLNTAATVFSFNPQTMNTAVLDATFPDCERFAPVKNIVPAPTPPSEIVDTTQIHIHDQTIAWLTDPKEPTHLVGA